LVLYDGGLVAENGCLIRYNFIFRHGLLSKNGCGFLPGASLHELEKRDRPGRQPPGTKK
jgi:hypothetical protein